MIFTRMPSGPQSMASALTSAVMPPLEAMYAARLGIALRLVLLPIKTMPPPPAPCICAAAQRHRLKFQTRFVSSTALNVSSGTVIVSCPMPRSAAQSTSAPTV